MVRKPLATISKLRHWLHQKTSTTTPAQYEFISIVVDRLITELEEEAQNRAGESEPLRILLHVHRELESHTH